MWPPVHIHNFLGKVGFSRHRFPRMLEFMPNLVVVHYEGEVNADKVSRVNSIDIIVSFMIFGDRTMRGKMMGTSLTITEIMRFADKLYQGTEVISVTTDDCVHRSTDG